MPTASEECVGLTPEKKSFHSSFSSAVLEPRLLVDEIPATPSAIGWLLQPICALILWAK